LSLSVLCGTRSAFDDSAYTSEGIKDAFADLTGTVAFDSVKCPWGTR